MTTTNVSTCFPTFRFIDLFAGIGGFRFALENLGGKCVFSSEWDKHARTTYKVNFGEEPSGDITKISVDDIPSHDVLTAGFPCQPFSVNGKQKGFEDTRGTLFFDIARIIQRHNPSVCFLENVANLKGHDKGNTFRVMMETMDSLGYDVYCEVLNASHYGVPQARKRLYFVCLRKDLGIGSFQFPTATNTDIVLADVLDPDEEIGKYIINHPSIVITNSKPVPRTLGTVRVGTIGNGCQGYRVYSPNGHAITLLSTGGGAAVKTGAYLVNGVVRKLSPQECRRVQGFPDSFVFPEGLSHNQLWKLFGNAVAVPVVQQIASSFLSLLNPEED